MKASTVTKSIIVFSLTLVLITMPSLAQVESSDFLQGKQDGKMAAKGNVVYTLLGVGCGVIGLIAAVVSEPEPPAEALIGKSEEYVFGYTEGYKNESRKKNIGGAVGGCALGIGLASLLSTLAQL